MRSWGGEEILLKLIGKEKSKLKKNTKYFKMLILIVWRREEGDKFMLLYVQCKMLNEHNLITQFFYHEEFYSIQYNDYTEILTFWDQVPLNKYLINSILAQL